MLAICFGNEFVNRDPARKITFKRNSVYLVRTAESNAALIFIDALFKDGVHIVNFRSLLQKHIILFHFACWYIRSDRPRRVRFAAKRAFCYAVFLRGSQIVYRALKSNFKVLQFVDCRPYFLLLRKASLAPDIVYVTFSKLILISVSFLAVIFMGAVIPAFSHGIWYDGWSNAVKSFTSICTRYRM